MSSSNDLLHTGFAPVRRASPHPRQMSGSQRSSDSRKGDSSGKSATGSRQHQPPSRKQSKSAMKDDPEKAELAQALLASISVRRTDRLEEMYPTYSSSPPTTRSRHDRVGRGKRSEGRDHRKEHTQGQGHAKQPDLGMNRFRFILAPASCFAEKPLQTVLALNTVDVWAHVVAVVANDRDPLCSICLDGIQAGRALACGHIFCAVCIIRCLAAAEADPMLQKCPVCTEGELSRSQLRRCEVQHECEQSETFTLVRAMNAEEIPPLSNSGDAMSSRVMVATGETMLKIIEKERKELAECKRDLTRFRDSEGMKLWQDVSNELDKAQVEWQRHVGKSKARPAAFALPLDPHAEWTYQRSNGSLDFLHPMNLRCMLKSHDGDVDKLPKIVKPVKIVEVEEWADRKFTSVVKLSRTQVPDFPPSIRIYEVELEGMSEEALASTEKERLDRARRRDEKHARKTMQELQEKEAEATLEEQRRKAREEEEALIRAFFGFEEGRAEREAKEAMERPQAAVNSFSAVVSSMGHFPALAKSPSLEPSKPPAAWATSPTLEPLRGAWATPSSSPSPTQQTSFSLSSSPPDSQVSFAQAASSTSHSKKMLWSNNPNRRANQ